MSELEKSFGFHNRFVQEQADPFLRFNAIAARAAFQNPLAFARADQRGIAETSNHSAPPRRRGFDEMFDFHAASMTGRVGQKLSNGNLFGNKASDGTSHYEAFGLIDMKTLRRRFVCALPLLGALASEAAAITGANGADFGTDWTTVGFAVESEASPGVFEFVDAEGENHPVRFYQVHFP